MIGKGGNTMASNPGTAQDGGEIIGVGPVNPGPPRGRFTYTDLVIRVPALLAGIVALTRGLAGSQR